LRARENALENFFLMIGLEPKVRREARSQRPALGSDPPPRRPQGNRWAPRSTAPERFVTLADLEARAAIKPPALADLSDRLVFGDGDPDADLMIVGEAPGEEEDLSGRPFVGRAGQLLDKVLASVDIDRADVYVTNIVKFRPRATATRSPRRSTPASRCCSSRSAGCGRR
jgi:uracil-DNA glycosylase